MDLGLRNLDAIHADDEKIVRILAKQCGVPESDIILIRIKPCLDTLEYECEFLVARRRVARIKGSAIR